MERARQIIELAGTMIGRLGIDPVGIGEMPTGTLPRNVARNERIALRETEMCS